MMDRHSIRNDKRLPKPSISLTRTFFGRNRPDEEDVSQYPRPGDTIRLDGFGGLLKLNDGVEVTLKELVEISVGGVIIFAFPKAHTPGCTKQVCLFRDAYHDLTSAGFAVYGLSRDSIPQNSSFSQKYRLPFRLICDEKATLINALGLRKKPNDTMRAVVVLNKGGRVLASMAGVPSATLESVAPIVQTLENQQQSPTAEASRDQFRRVPLYPTSAIDHGSPSEPAQKSYHPSCSPACQRTRSSERDNLQARSRSSSQTSQTSSPTRTDLFADKHSEVNSTIAEHGCILCGREHRGDETCLNQVEMIHETVASLEASGVMEEARQRELANKLALVSGELALIAARIDAQYREEQRH